MAETYIIVGATGGVGNVIARGLSAKGHHLHLIGRDAVKLGLLCSELDSASYAIADADTPDQVATAVSEGAKSDVAGLVYAIGSIDLKPMARVKNLDMMHAFQINVATAVAAVQAAAKALKSAGGAVVLYSSVAAQRGFPNHVITGTVKAAIEGLTVALAADMAPTVRINTIAPSLLDTGMARPILSSTNMAEAIAKAHPLGRVGTAEDVAHLTQLLLQKETWITGQIFGVDGGRATIAGK